MSGKTMFYFIFILADIMFVGIAVWYYIYTRKTVFLPPPKELWELDKQDYTFSFTFKNCKMVKTAFKTQNGILYLKLSSDKYYNGHVNILLHEINGIKPLLAKEYKCELANKSIELTVNDLKPNEKYSIVLYSEDQNNEVTGSGCISNKNLCLI